MISQEKLEFLGSVAKGVFEILYEDDRIGRILMHPRNRVERYIAESFTGSLGWYGLEITCSPEFFTGIVEGELRELLEYLENNGVGLLRVYEESESVDESSLIVDEIRKGRMVSFRQF